MYIVCGILSTAALCGLLSLATCLGHIHYDQLTCKEVSGGQG
jgi:hypothetical protein